MEPLKNIKNLSTESNRVMMRIGIATNFGWFELKRKLIEALNAVGYELADIGAYELVPGENYPDFVIPLTKSNSGKKVPQNLFRWENEIEACKTVNKIPGVCAVLITEPIVTCMEDENEDLYVRCVGGQIKGYALSRKKVMTFLNADRSSRIPSNQRLAKVNILGRTKKMADGKKYFA